MNVAIFGGSFDPPHLCHVQVVALALSREALDKVLVVVCNRHPLAKDLTPFDHRYEMAVRAFGLFGDLVEVSAVEARLEGVSRTIHTLLHLAEAHPDWRMRLLVGTDILEERDQWHRFDDVVRLAPPLVVGRQGHGDTRGPDFALPDISSRKIRRLAAAGEPMGHLVPRSVEEYISQAGLYTVRGES